MSDAAEFMASTVERSTTIRSGSVQNFATAPQQPPIATSQNIVAHGGARQWAASDDTFWGATETHGKLPAGFYRTGYADGVGYLLNKQAISTDDLLVLPDEAATSIVAEFTQFWGLRDQFKSRGFMHKRGFMLFGPPGSGKTSAIQQMAKKLIDGGDVVLFLDQPSIAAGCLRLLRALEPDRPVVAILEDIDALIERYGKAEWLALLDGESHVDRIVFIATTNYPERLDRRFVDRPSRFDTIRKIGMPSPDARRVYLKTKEPSLNDIELKRWVDASDGYSIAHLKEMIIAIKCFGQSLEAVRERLDAMREQPISSADDRRRVGMLGLK